MPQTFDGLGGLIDPGTYDEYIPLNYPYEVKSSLIEWTEIKPSGTDIVVTTQLSLDGGNTWLTEQPCVSGQPIPDVEPRITDLSNAVLRFHVQMSTSVSALPVISEIRITITAYLTTSSWISDVIDVKGLQPKTSSLTWTETLPPNTNVKVYERYSYDGENWSEWVLRANGDPISQTGFYKQIKIEMTPDTDTRTISPTVDDVQLNITEIAPYGVWISPSVDVSQAEDLSSVKIKANYDSGDDESGVIQVLAQTSDDGVTWNAPQAVLLDGSIQNTPGNYVKAYVILYNAAEVESLTISLDGDTELVLLKEALTISGEYDFTTLRDISIITNGVDSPMKWDGLTQTTELLGGSPPVMTMVESHHNRVWGVEKAYKSRVRFSGILDPESWDAFDFLDFNPEDGDEITAFVKYGQNIVVSKRYSMALITGNTSLNYGITWLDTSYGATGQYALTVVDRWLGYVADDGIRLTDLVDNYLISEDIQPDWEEINHSRLSQAAVVYWQHKFYIALPKEGSLYNNTVWCYDINRRAWSIFDGWCVSRWLKFKQYGQEVLLAANSQTGQVHRILSESYGGDESPEYEFITKEWTFDVPERYKLFKTVYLDLQGVAEETTLEMDFIVDGNVVGTYTTTIPAGDGVDYTKSVLPPLYGAVLGKSLALAFRGKCTIKGINIEYVLKGTVPPDQEEVV